nr:uncharacterized protein LOC105849882 [Hydra vulgaris]XP_047133933.1 uncharacterized protein LOC124812036 isoform X1 [Hydra vulgaris]
MFYNFIIFLFYKILDGVEIFKLHGSSVIVDGYFASTHLQCFTQVKVQNVPESDYFAPSPPQLHVHGKTEISIEWDPPKNLLGRLNYYELRMDNMIIYRGIDRCFTAQAFHPTKVYGFTVSAWMSEGRCESLHRTRRISKQ